MRAGPTAQEKSQAPAQPQDLVIVGFGMVGFKLVERLSALDVLDRFQITLIGEEPYPVYDRIHLTEWLDHGDFDHLALGRPGWSEVPGVRTLTRTFARNGMRACPLCRGVYLNEMHYVRHIAHRQDDMIYISRLSTHLSHKTKTGEHIVIYVSHGGD